MSGAFEERADEQVWYANATCQTLLWEQVGGCARGRECEGIHCGFVNDERNVAMIGLLHIGAIWAERAVRNEFAKTKCCIAAAPPDSVCLRSLS